MFGQLAPLGTGAFELMLDTSKLKDARYIPDKNLVTEVNNFELEEEYSMVPSTPSNLMGTPSQTPGGMTVQRTPISTDAGFTPYVEYSKISPQYTPHRDPDKTPVSPYGARHKSPIYQPTSPGYSPSSNHSSPSIILVSIFIKPNLEKE